MATLAFRSGTVPLPRSLFRNGVGWPLLLALLITASLWLGWTGFIASDDALYYQGASRWLSHAPFAGSNHWSTRFPLILSFTGWLALLGRGLGAFAATALSWYAALLLVFGLFARAIGGTRTGWIATILAATMPVIVANATTVSCDLPEAALLIAGAWAVGSAEPHRPGLLRALGGGVCFGAAILCRETSLLSLVAFAPLLLFGHPLGRRVILAAGIGVALVIGGEMLLQWALTGDALHRYTLAYHHDEHIDRAANLEGNVLVHPAIDPLLVLLVNNDFGLLFWAAMLAAGLGATRGMIDRPRRLLIVFGAMAAADFLLVAVMTHKLVLNPRYFLIPALLAAVVTARWIATLRPLAQSGALAVLVGINLLMMSVENPHPRWVAEALVIAAREHPGETIITDRATAARADLPLAFARLHNVRVGAPIPGGLTLVTTAAPRATVAARYPSPPTRLGAVLHMLHLQPLILNIMGRRLFAPNPEAMLVRG